MASWGGTTFLDNPEGGWEGEEPTTNPTWSIGLLPLQPEGIRLEKTVKIVELDPKTKGISEWPRVALGMSQPHGDVPVPWTCSSPMGMPP